MLTTTPEHASGSTAALCPGQDRIATTDLSCAAFSVQLLECEPAIPPYHHSESDLFIGQRYSMGSEVVGKQDN